MYVWDSTTGRVSFDVGSVPFVGFEAWSVDSAEFVVADCKEIRRYDVACGGYFGGYAGHVAKQVDHFMVLVRDGKFTPDGTRLLTLGADGTIRAWSVASGRQIGDAKPDRPGDFLLLAPSGSYAMLVRRKRDENGAWQGTDYRLFDPNTLLPTGDWQKAPEEWPRGFLGERRAIWDGESGVVAASVDDPRGEALPPEEKSAHLLAVSAPSESYVVGLPATSEAAIVRADGQITMISAVPAEDGQSVIYDFAGGGFSPDSSIVYLVHPIAGLAAYDAATGEKRLQFETPANS
ncbi:WD40 repeat domain-containing protein [Tessaracoccus sp. OH4464_COT-324]|uniref:WD40 repeat domain-containing protein n=1 Tax=Tessaracoccus sp. OH4464_COT-324 TaxID=2491059 RepID=UPI000F63A712|nr:WD40 repeat domain-containing protein [Tessaracoccus sp. OH4464_COT-324]RRD46512.1 WD40 repeat domain-containing protein [Tessaracoccus sp. OH4464_COT-324]